MCFSPISTSGRSPNVLRALEAARDLGLVTVGFTGVGNGDARAMPAFSGSDLPGAAIVQRIHMVAGHAVCALVEHEFLHSPDEPVASMAQS